MDFRQHQVEPNNSQSSYSEYNQVDFTFSFAGRKMEANTVRLLADIELENVTNYSNFKVDNFIGGHAFIQEVLTSTVQQGLVESLSSYGRYEGMLNKAVNSSDNLFRSDQVCELKSMDSSTTGRLMKGVEVLNTADGTVLATANADVSLKPNICINNVVGDQYISHNKTGDITVSIRLARNADFSFGSDNSGTTGYKLSNLRMTFNSVPDDGKEGSHVLRTKVTLEQVVDSNFTSISAQVPAVCTGVSASMMTSARLGQPKLNNFEQNRIPDLNSLQFLFNNSESEYITYEITSNADATQRYLESWAEISNNRANMEVLNANDAYGLGLDFQAPINLANQKWGLQLDATVNESYMMYLYFHGLVTL